MGNNKSYNSDEVNLKILLKHIWIKKNKNYKPYYINETVIKLLPIVCQLNL